MTHQVISLYREESVEEQIRTMNYDASSEKIALLIRSGSKPDEHSDVDRRVFRLKLFDLKTSTVQINILLTKPEIIGIMTSGYYTFVNGHIYHNNHVIKMRYDLLEANHQLHENLAQDEFFDLYENVFSLRPGCRISSASLLNSLEAHRFAFLSEDTQNQLLPSLVRITPYLHERRVYLRQKAPNKRYFLTSLDIKTEDRQRYNQHLYEQIVGKSKLENEDERTRDDGIEVA